MKNTQQKIFTIILDETNKLKERDIAKYLLKYSNNDELNRITFIARYKNQNGWHLQFSQSKRLVYAQTLKDLVIKLIATETYLDELVGGEF